MEATVIQRDALSGATETATQVRIVTDERDLELCLRLRRLVFENELGERDVRLKHTTRDSLDDTAIHIGAFAQGRCIGYLRLNLGDHSSNPYRDLYNLASLEEQFGSRIGITSKLCVSPEYRGSPITHRLIRIAYQACLNGGIQRALIGCHIELASFYARMGFVPTHQSKIIPGIGEISVQILDIWNMSHLQKVRSPFLKLLKRQLSENLNQEPTKELVYE